MRALQRLAAAIDSWMLRTARREQSRSDWIDHTVQSG
jgi:hypothetical protein